MSGASQSLDECPLHSGKLNGSLRNLEGSQLGSIVIKACLERVGLDPGAGHVDEVIMGQVLTGGKGQNPARQAAVNAGLPHSVPATTVNAVCGSGLKYD